MTQLKPWQIVVMVAAVVALGVSIYMTFGRGDGLDLVNSIRMVDVNTGEEFRLKIGKGGATVPGRNPKTQEYTLLPVVERSDGQLVIEERSLSILKKIPGDHGAVDSGTGEIRSKR